MNDTGSQQPPKLPGRQATLCDRLKPISAGIRQKCYVRLFSGIAPYFVVNEYPKSGGTWLAQMLSEVLDAPFRRNQPIRLERAVTHGHFLSPLGIKNSVVLWRDPRDVVVSWYFHCFFVNEHGNDLLVHLMKDRLKFTDYNDVHSNLPAFIRFISNRPVTPSFDWPTFADVWVKRPGTVQTSYEVLRRDTVGELSRIAMELTGLDLDEKLVQKAVARYDFYQVKKAADRHRSGKAEISFLREGSVGGWRRHFSYTAHAELHKLGYTKQMHRLGYETLTEIEPSQKRQFFQKDGLK